VSSENISSTYSSHSLIRVADPLATPIPPLPRLIIADTAANAFCKVNVSLGKAPKVVNIVHMTICLSTWVTLCVKKRRMSVSENVGLRLGMTGPRVV
jgi:hypothetical protein